MRLLHAIALLYLIILLTSCSGGGSSILSPSLEDEGLMGLRTTIPPRLADSDGHFLYGFWKGLTDRDTGLLEVTPVRTTAFHLNPVGLNPSSSTPWLEVEVKSYNPTTRILNADVTMTHPCPNSDFRGFDIRGILLGPGPVITSQSDPDLCYPSGDGLRVVNADGYTRWWNALEFTTPGLFGYSELYDLPDYLEPTCTLNPYKYFSDPLDSDDPVVPGVNETNRGTFSTDLPAGSITRNYRIRFPEISGNPQLGFYFAVDASWAKPTGTSPSPKPIEDFPPRANCPEAFHIEVDASDSTLWYENDQENGGDLVMDIEVFDWGANSNPDGILGEIDSILIESPNVFGSYYSVPLNPLPGSQPCSAIFNVNLPSLSLPSADNQDILITVISAGPDNYQPPVGAAAYPEQAALAAYALIEVPVYNAIDDIPTIELTTPNGGEFWGISESQLISWDWTGEISPVDISLSLDGGESFEIQIASSTPNFGEFEIESVGEWTTDQAIVRIASVTDPDIYDLSDATFLIGPYIEVVKPDGNELLLAGTSSVITWEASDSIQNLAIILSINSGGDFVNPITMSTPNTGQYDWSYIDPGFISDK